MATPSQESYRIPLPDIHSYIQHSGNYSEGIDLWVKQFTDFTNMYKISEKQFISYAIIAEFDRTFIK